MAETRNRDHSTAGDADEAALRPFFVAARAAEVPPRTALLSAILADAADVAAAQRLAPAPAPARSAGLAARLRRSVAPLGGWRGLTTLAASAALGFWLGLAGNLSIDGTTLSVGQAAAASADDPVADFFDLASAEN